VRDLWIALSDRQEARIDDHHLTQILHVRFVTNILDESAAAIFRIKKKSSL
jgi:hypothetical protein